ncbi:hypothetical protein CAPTEDRAFT_221412 [Capitella teleta]|uniref:Inorganic pyrophosphatase n=1 Tax=Capitella teleta TaxID=283909 RepID=R7UU43_CAPTE|nr:hypothetical protein CAPTEDRAFT_221412 [Capitella teleta]|eukprot:ELU10029.1 hypothetical protein CAPTEDRAFT_221412 [Capitella teleta]
MSYTAVEKGELNSLDYRIYFKNASGVAISPFHDIPLKVAGKENVFNMVVEVPRWTNAKMEISTAETLNPIKQDVKKGKLRFVHNCFPHHGYIWNYGALPQTWEDPTHTDEHTSMKGDNDPLDVCEIGFKVHKRGAVVQVKVLGVMALIDEGETDWKVIVCDVTDPMAEKLNDINDVETHMPGFLAATTEWFRIYKIPAGKPANEFAFDGKAKNKDFALKVIQQTNEQWQALVGKAVDNGGLSCENTTVLGSPYQISADESKQILEAAPAVTAGPPLEQIVDQWHYVKL